MWLYIHVAMQSVMLNEIFSALSDPTRRAMVERLSHGPASISELSSGFPLSQPAISKHVKILEASGLLQRDIAGRTHVCRVNPDAVLAAAAWCEEQRAFWNSTFDRLDAYLSKYPEPPSSPTTPQVKRKRKQ